MSKQKRGAVAGPLSLLSEKLPGFLDWNVIPSVLHAAGLASSFKRHLTWHHLKEATPNDPIPSNPAKVPYETKIVLCSYCSLVHLSTSSTSI